MFCISPIESQKSILTFTALEISPLRVIYLPLWGQSTYKCHETFRFMISLPAMSVSGSSLETTWLALGGPFRLNGVRNK